MSSAACGMWFARVIELFDSDPPERLYPGSRTARTATAIKLNTPISRVERGTKRSESFEHSVHGPKSHHQPELASSSNMRSLEDSEAATQEEISRFKRVRMIKRQFREKNRISKTDSALLSQGAANQKLDKNGSYPTQDSRITASVSPSPPNFSAPLPRQGRAISEAKENVEQDGFSDFPTRTSSKNVNFEHHNIFENGRGYHNVSYPSCCCYY
jgi:hypothetical protein